MGMKRAFFLGMVLSFTLASCNQHESKPSPQASNTTAPMSGANMSEAKKLLPPNCQYGSASARACTCWAKNYPRYTICNAGETCDTDPSGSFPTCYRDGVAQKREVQTASKRPE